jgi:hypothetical protein
MGCCNLKQEKVKFSKKEFLLRRIIASLINFIFKIIIFIVSLFNKKYSNILKAFLLYEKISNLENSK